MKTKRQKAIEKQLDLVKERLTEKGYREFIKKASSCSTEYFQNGGTLNWADFERKPTATVPA